MYNQAQTSMNDNREDYSLFTAGIIKDVTFPIKRASKPERVIQSLRLIFYQILNCTSDSITL